MKRYLLIGTSFFLFAMLCFLALGVRTVPDNFVDAVTVDGVADLSDVDFAGDVASLGPECFTHYPDQLLAPGEDGGETGDWAAPTGTARVTLRLPDGVYAFSQTAPDHALRLFADGRVVAAWGTVGATADESRAMAGTLQGAFAVRGGEVDLSFQHSGFVRHYGAPTAYVGSVENIGLQLSRLVMRDVLFAACLLTACLLFLGMFLLYGRKAQFLFFSLCCGCLALYSLVTGSVPLSLVWPVDAVFAARVEYLAVWCAAFAFFAYLDALFPGVFHRAARIAALVVMGIFGASIIFLFPWEFTPLRTVYLAIQILLMLYVAVMLLWRVHRPRGEQALVLAAALLLMLTAALEESLLRWVLPYWYGTGFLTATAMVAMVLLNMVALAMNALRSEQDLEDARRLEETLQQSNRSLDLLNRLQQTFMQTISHELHTPLGILSGHAQLSAQILREGGDIADIPRRLDAITQEANRLSALSSRLMDETPAPGGGDGLSEPNEAARRCAELMEPLLQKRKNKLRTMLAPDAPDTNMDTASLTQILLNLLTNANSHTKKSMIEVGTKAEDGGALLWVKDNGSGIAPELLPHIFERGAR
ncbi:MAG: sensor histidine kinase, partial [Clostridiales bacterium]|nr:sensor histidine kinase [Clostridiales bacterium]